MKIFISWSGERSKIVAQSLRVWLPKVIQAVKPWMSNEDIESGMKWSNEISGELEKSNFGIICITNENQSNPWITFEAGALSKTIESAYVCPFLFDLEPSQLSGPISQFQARKTNKEGTLKILKTINNALDNKSLQEDELDEIFEVWWPKLSDNFDKVPKYEGKKIDNRTTEDILSEIVINTREQLRREELRLDRSSEMSLKMDTFISLVQNMGKSTTTDLSSLNSIKNQLLKKYPDKSDLLNINLQNSGIKEMLENLKDLKDMDDSFTDKLLNPNELKE
jgi:hypothetical protein